MIPGFFLSVHALTYFHIHPAIIVLNIGQIISFNYILGNDADVQFHVFWIREMVVQLEMIDVCGEASGIESGNYAIQKSFCCCDCCIQGAQNSIIVY